MGITFLWEILEPFRQNWQMFTSWVSVSNVQVSVLEVTILTISLVKSMDTSSLRIPFRQFRIYQNLGGNTGYSNLRCSWRKQPSILGLITELSSSRAPIHTRPRYDVPLVAPSCRPWVAWQLCIVHPMNTLEDLWGLGKLPSSNICGAPLNVVPFIWMRPFLVPIEVETEIKNTLNQWFPNWE